MVMTLIFIVVKKRTRINKKSDPVKDRCYNKFLFALIRLGKHIISHAFPSVNVFRCYFLRMFSR